MRMLAEAGWGAKRIAREVGAARNTVRRYLRSRDADVQRRPTRRALDHDFKASLEGSKGTQIRAIQEPYREGGSVARSRRRR